jgi:hypothetical protein
MLKFRELIRASNLSPNLQPLGLLVGPLMALGHYAQHEDFHGHPPHLLVFSFVWLVTH